MSDLPRRRLIGGALGVGSGLTVADGVRGATGTATPRRRAGISSREFGAVGDGLADDTEALQRTLDHLVANRGGVLVMPPGRYRIRRTLRLHPPAGKAGDITHACVIRAHGVRLESEIRDRSPVLSVDARSVFRYLTIEGLEIEGRGGESHGLLLNCQRRGSYLYNFALRDVIVENCAGDGCRMVGNVFEGQLFNCYFRDNGGNGASMSHGDEDTVLSAVHAFGCVFGGNARHGVELSGGAADIGFQGCYFLLNGAYGLVAPNGCTLLSHCGFENNHRRAAGFDTGGAGVRLLVQGTLVGCTAYSIRNQTHLIDAYVTGTLTMVGCVGHGGAQARGAGLARLNGRDGGRVVLVGTTGRIEDDGGVDVLRLHGEGARFGARWDSANLAKLGDYQLWVDGAHRLRMKQGRPRSDTDGRVVGS